MEPNEYMPRVADLVRHINEPGNRNPAENLAVTEDAGQVPTAVPTVDRAKDGKAEAEVPMPLQMPKVMLQLEERLVMFAGVTRGLVEAAEEVCASILESTECPVEDLVDSRKMAEGGRWGVRVMWSMNDIDVSLRRLEWTLDRLGGRVE